MAGEEGARRIIERELNRTVAVHDDGSQPGMYDLRIGMVDAPDMAIECVGAVDAISTETWNVGPARGALHLAVQGNWVVTIARNARVRRIRQRIELLLRELEARGLYDLHENHILKPGDDPLFQELESLGIQHATGYTQAGIGRVYLTMDGTGGAVDSAGSALPQWIEAFLVDPQRADVLSKLARSSAAERHAFVFVTLGGAPWAVESYLTDDFDLLPATKPNLPPPVTGVWIVHTFGTHGVRWDGAGWQLFKARDESS